jgi:hypothetical protein
LRWPRTTPGSVSTSRSWLGEPADLLLGEGDVGQVLLRERGEAAVDLGGGEPVVVAVPAVELHGQFADGRVAAGLDVGEDRLDGVADLPVAAADGLGVDGSLEPGGHDVLGAEGEITQLVAWAL